MARRRLMPWLVFGFVVLAVVAGYTVHSRHQGPPESPCSLGSSGSPAGRGLCVLYPPNRSVVHSDTVQVVAVAGEVDPEPGLVLDGEPLVARRIRLKNWRNAVGKDHTSTRPAQSAGGSINPSGGSVRAGGWALVATASLEPGEHVIAAGQQRVRVFAVRPNGGRAAPAGWPVFRPHPPAPVPGQSGACSACHEMTEAAAGPELSEPQMPDACFSCHTQDNFELIHAHRVEVLTACQMCHESHGGTAPSLLTDSAEILCAGCHE